MIQPSKMFCDFCATPIEEGRHFVKIALPIPPSLRQELVRFAESDAQTRAVTSPLSGAIGLEALVPHVWAVEVCVPCVYGIMPAIREKLAEQIRAAIARAIAAKRRTAESIVEIEIVD